MELIEKVGKDGKAGFLPYVMENGEPVFLFMVSSDPRFGGPKPGIAKGHVDEGEDIKQAGMREAEEELGLKKSNLILNTIQKVTTEQMTGMTATYPFTVYTGEVKDKDDFNKPHYETGSTHWLTAATFAKVGRASHLKIVIKAAELVKH